MANDVGEIDSQQFHLSLHFMFHSRILSRIWIVLDFHISDNQIPDPYNQ